MRLLFSFILLLLLFSCKKDVNGEKKQTEVVSPDPLKSTKEKLFNYSWNVKAVYVYFDTVGGGLNDDSIIEIKHINNPNSCSLRLGSNTTSIFSVPYFLYQGRHDGYCDTTNFGGGLYRFYGTDVSGVSISFDNGNDRQIEVLTNDSLVFYTPENNWGRKYKYCFKKN